jgi:cytochrome o ubiquinol oxidase subunit 3
MADTITQAEAEAAQSDTFFVVEDEHAGGHGHGSPTLLGFWIYLMSDALLFAGLFATYGVLSTSYAGGPVPQDVFDLRLVALNTAILLVSSITFGFGMLAMERGKLAQVQFWLLITGLLGAAFVGIELYEFSHFAHEGAVPQRSAYWSGVWTLVGTHGLHVTVGIVWVLVLMVQLKQRGLLLENKRRLMCLSMFWHFLDVIWIGVFSYVYLLGMIQ